MFFKQVASVAFKLVTPAVFAQTASMVCRQVAPMVCPDVFEQVASVAEFGRFRPGSGLVPLGSTGQVDGWNFREVE